MVGFRTSVAQSLCGGRHEPSVCPDPSGRSGN
jgi:hypothetical protein